MRFVYCCFIIVFVVLSSHLSLSASTLRVIAVADTDDIYLYDAFTLDKDYVTSVLSTFAERSGMELETCWFAGKNANPDQVAHFLNDPSFAVSADDAILFYYAGHGCRTKDTKTDLPLLIFGNENDINGHLHVPGNKVIDFSEIVANLQARHPRLLIAIADCCNSFVPEVEKFEPEYVPISNVTISNSDEDTNEDRSLYYQGYVNLFAKSKGHIVIAGSTPGNVIVPECLNQLTLAFFSCLVMDPWMNPAITWHELLHKVEIMMNHQIDHSEYPIIQIDLVE